MAVDFDYLGTDVASTLPTKWSDTFKALAKMTFDGTESGLPTGAISINSNKFKKWNGASFDDLKFDTLYSDTISEKTSGNGVTVDGAVFKDGGATFTGGITGTTADFSGIVNLTNSVSLLNVGNLGRQILFGGAYSTINLCGSTESSSGAVVLSNSNSDISGAFWSDASITHISTSGIRSLVLSGSALSANNFVINTDGNIGINISNPIEKLHVDNGNFLVTGTFGSSPSLSTSGAGTKCFFYPRKAAFRAGYINGTQWDDANIGDYSFASGVNTRASGNASFSCGTNTIALGNFSFACGNNAEASGNNSTAMGVNSTASGFISFAINLDTGTGPDVPDNTFRISGATAIGGNVAWTNYSDRREKEDIRELKSELENICKLKPSIFKWKKVNEGVKKFDVLGLIAQEVREVYPEVVKGDEKKEILTLEYTGLIAPIIKAIQELSKKINKMEKNYGI